MSSKPKHAGLNPPTASAAPLLPLPPHCIVAAFVQRRKRFSVLLQHEGQDLWVHSNNSGSMLGLCLPGAPVLHAAVRGGEGCGAGTGHVRDRVIAVRRDGAPTTVLLRMGQRPEPLEAPRRHLRAVS